MVNNSLTPTSKKYNVAAYLPNFVLRENSSGYRQKTIFALFIDIDGFTQLSQEYGVQAHSGVDELTTELNVYLSQIVSCIQQYKGDIIHFAGDAVFCIWDVDDPTVYRSDNIKLQYSKKAVQKNVSDCPNRRFALDLLNYPYESSKYGTIQLAKQIVQCAIEIHKLCDFYKTPQGKILTLKTAISYGEAYQLIICKQMGLSYYFVYGKSIEELQACEQLSERTRIYMTSTIWQMLINDDDCSLYLSIPFTMLSAYMSNNDHLCIVAIPIASLSKSFLLQIKRNTFKLFSKQYSTITDRDKLISLVNKDTEHNDSLRMFLRSFLSAKHIIERIEQGEPVERLSELRHISTCFIDFLFEPGLKADTRRFTDVIADLLNKIEFIVRRFKGIVLKITTFDKGWAMLLGFGLPETASSKSQRISNVYPAGNKSAVNALTCSMSIKQLVSNMFHNYVLKCSIGVTTGLAYCGVVGHPNRHEYTCIGNKVNMSARLMSNYINIISCDEETFWLSKLPRECFISLPTVYLKGIGNQKVRSLIQIPLSNETGNQLKLSGINEYRKCKRYFGHKLEFTLIAVEICKMLSALKIKEDTNETASHQHTDDRHHMFVFYCGIGSGKTSFLKYLVYMLSMSEIVNPIFIKLAEPDKVKSLDGVRCLVKHLANFEKITNVQSKSEDSKSILTNIQLTMKSLANDRQRRSSDRSASLSTDDILTNDLIYFLYRLIEDLGDFMFLLAIDDLQFVDKESLQVFSKFSASKNVITVAVVHPLHTLNEEKQAEIAYFISNCNTILSWPSETNLTNNNALMTTHTKINPLQMAMTNISKSEMFNILSQHFKIHYIEKPLFDTLYQNFSLHPAVCVEVVEELLFKEKAIIGQTLEAKQYYSRKVDHDHGYRNLLQHIFYRQSALRVTTALEIATVNKCIADHPGDIHFDGIAAAPLLSISLVGMAKTKLISTTVEHFLYQLYDSVGERDKIILDAFSSIGKSASRAHLKGICCNRFMDVPNFNIAIQQLISCHVIGCGRKRLNKLISLSSIDYKTDSYEDPEDEDDSQFISNEILPKSKRNVDQRIIHCYCPENYTDLAFMCKFLTFSMDSMRWSLYNRQTSISRRKYVEHSIEWLESLKDELICEHCSPGGEYVCVFDIDQESVIRFDDRSSSDVNDIQSIVKALQISSVEKSIISLDLERKLEKQQSTMLKTSDQRQQSGLETSISEDGTQLKQFSARLTVDAGKNKGWMRVSENIILHSIMYGTHSIVSKIKDGFNQHDFGVNDLLSKLLVLKSTTKSFEQQSFQELYQSQQHNRFIRQHLPITSNSSLGDDSGCGGRRISFPHQESTTESISHDELEENLMNLSVNVEKLLPLKRDYYNARECHCNFIKYKCLKELVSSSEIINDKIRIAFYTDRMALIHILSNRAHKGLEYLQKSNSIIYNEGFYKNSTVNDEYGFSSMYKTKSGFENVEDEQMEMWDLVICAHEYVWSCYYYFHGDIRLALSKSVDNFNVLASRKENWPYLVVQFICVILETTLRHGTLSMRSRYKYINEILLITLNHFDNYLNNCNKHEIPIIDKYSILLSIIADQLYCINEHTLATDLCRKFYEIYAKQQLVDKSNLSYSTNGSILAAYSNLTATFRLFQLGLLHSAIDFAYRSKQVFTSLSCIDTIPSVFVYLSLILINQGNVNKLVEAIYELKSTIDNSINNQNKSLGLNIYYTICVDIYDVLGISLKREIDTANIGLNQLCRHAELLNDSDFGDLTSEFYSLSTVAQAYTRRECYSKCILQFAKALRFIVACTESEDRYVNMANPVVQNCLLKLVECQLVYQANCLQNIESSLWLLDKCRECIDKKSLWYPKLIYYQAVEARLLGKHELYRTLAESSLRLSGQSESVLIHTWIKHNMMAVDQGWNKNKTARNYTVWNGDQTKISYYILPI